MKDENIEKTILYKFQNPLVTTEQIENFKSKKYKKLECYGKLKVNILSLTTPKIIYNMNFFCYPVLTCASLNAT